MERQIGSSTRALLAAALLSLVAAPAAIAGEAVSGASDATKPFVVKIHADWCGTCRALEGPLQELQARQGDALRFVLLDVTDGDATAAATAEADRLGIRTFFDEHKGKTGTVGVLSGSDRAVVGVFKGELDPAAYESLLERARSDTSS